MHNMDNDIDHVLVSEAELKAKVAELGARITRDYEGPGPAAGLYPEGIGCLYGRPDARSEDALRHRLHGGFPAMAAQTRPPPALSKSSRIWTPT